MVRVLVGSLTAKDLRSLAGLDNAGVAGMKNFENMRGLARELGQYARMDETEIKSVIEQIDLCETFHTVSFTRHLGDQTEHVCGCLNCGFHVPDDPTEQICCSHRAAGTHTHLSLQRRP